MNIGQIIKEKEHRDAIHIAVIPVTSGEDWLRPGQRVKLQRNSQSIVRDCHESDDHLCIGIVDPFLTQEVDKGEEFFLFLLPNTITTLRHQWTHPAFEPEDAPTPNQTAMKVAAALSITPAKQLLMNFADSLDEDYEELMSHAESYLADGNYWSKGGKFESQDIPAGFWEAYNEVTGSKVDVSEGSFFSCSC